MVTTQAVLAIGAVGVLGAGMAAYLTDRVLAGYWLLAAGFGIATLWSIVGATSPLPTAAGMSTETYLLLGTTAGASAVYFAHTAIYTPTR
ncbi:MAG: hypothetical protein ABEJ77_06710 [Halanaeroarchaeum sp.]